MLDFYVSASSRLNEYARTDNLILVMHVISTAITFSVIVGDVLWLLHVKQIDERYIWIGSHLPSGYTNACWMSEPVSSSEGSFSLSYAAIFVFMYLVVTRISDVSALATSSSCFRFRLPRLLLQAPPRMRLILSTRS